MGKDYIGKLLIRLAQKKTIVKATDEKNQYSENRARLISLLLDHPHYIEQVRHWRQEFYAKEVPTDSEHGIFLWEHSHKEERATFRNKITDFVNEFNFNAVYRNDVEQFTYNHVLCPSRNERAAREHVPALVVVDTDNDRSINAQLISPSGRYVQVFEWTTLRDIQEHWESIKLAGVSSDLGVDVGEDLSRLLWQLQLEGLSVKQLVQKVNTDHQQLLANVSGGVLGEDAARIYLHRYKSKLKKLRPF